MWQSMRQMGQNVNNWRIRIKKIRELILILFFKLKFEVIKISPIKEPAE